MTRRSPCASCFVLMCGLPASGKTTFVKKLKKAIEHSGKCNVIHVCYDELIPESSHSNSDENGDVKNWKSSREDIVCALKSCIYETTTPGAAPSYNLDRASLTRTWCRLNVTPYIRQKQPYAIVIDDNMYYHSMRYRYYQLARSVNAGFCQVYLRCPVAAALQRNSGRPLDARVPDRVIERMDARIEPPDASIYHWERDTVTLSSNYDDTELQKVVDLIHHNLHNPVPEMPLQDEDGKDSSRQQTSASLLHQADQILRQLVSATIKLSVSNVKAGVDVKALSSNMLERKQRILEEIKSGCLRLPESATSDVANASKQPESSLYQFLSNIFHAKMS